jgi:hypothetical protein
MSDMKSIRSTRPAARKAAKTTAKRSATVKAKKAGGGTVAKKAGASLRGTARVSASARAELTSLLDSIHYNLDQTEALLAD